MKTDRELLELAAKALQGMLANGEGNIAAIVKDAYLIANSMPEARK